MVASLGRPLGDAFRARKQEQFIEMLAKRTGVHVQVSRLFDAWLEWCTRCGRRAEFHLLTRRRQKLGAPLSGGYWELSPAHCADDLNAGYRLGLEVGPRCYPELWDRLRRTPMPDLIERTV